MKYSQEEHRQWFNSQPRKPVSAAVLFTNDAEQVLLVKPNYRDTWNLPGGVVDKHESPLDGAIRELSEELGLKIDKTSLQFRAVDYRPAEKELADKLYFYFYGGVLSESMIASIKLQEEELEELRFVSIESAKELLGEWTYRQVVSALSEETNSLYLEKGFSVSRVKS